MEHVKKTKGSFLGNKSVFTASFLLIVFIAAAIVINMSSVEIADGVLHMRGPYGMDIRGENIKSISLRDSLPQNLKRDNGMDLLGMKHMGNYSSKELGKIKMLVHTKKKPYLYIELKNHNYNYIVVSLKDKQQTEQLYNDIMKLK